MGGAILDNLLLERFADNLILERVSLDIAEPSILIISSDNLKLRSRITVGQRRRCCHGVKDYPEYHRDPFRMRPAEALAC